MKIYRIITYVAACVAFLCLSGNAKAELSEPLLKYKTACVAMKKALDSKDKNTMHKALELLDNLDIACMADDSYTVSSGEFKTPTTYFLADYADNLLLHDFVIADLDETSLLRETSLTSEVSVIHCALDAGASISFDIEGDGHMEVMVFSNSGTPVAIKVDDLSLGLGYDEYTVDGASSSMTWEMTDGGMFRLYVKNNSEKDTEIVVALN